MLRVARTVKKHRSRHVKPQYAEHRAALLTLLAHLARSAVLSPDGHGLNGTLRPQLSPPSLSRTAAC